MMLKILSDDRFNEIGLRIETKNKRYIEINKQILKIYKEIRELLKNSENGNELLDELGSLNIAIIGLQSEEYYNHGFRDCLKFLLIDKG